MFAITFTFITLIMMWAQLNARYPFTPNNMYVWELLTIGVGALFLSLQPNNEKIGTGFLANILTRSVPAAATQVLVCAVYFIISFASNEQIIDIPTATTMAVLTFSIGSFIVLIRICMPFDIYRVALIIALVIIGVIFYLIDIFVFYPNLQGTGFFQIDYKLLLSNNWWILLIVIAASVPMYMGLETISVRVYDYFIKPRRKDLLN